LDWDLNSSLLSSIIVAILPWSHGAQAPNYSFKRTIVVPIIVRLAQALDSQEQHMKLSTRYSLVGMAALGTLSLVHLGRKSHYDGSEIVLYLMGVLPNVAAAIAIPFILLSIWADQNQRASYSAARRSFVLVTLVAGVGLIAWEFIQQSSRTLVFDTHDIGATILGLGIGGLLFTLLTPK
jgi:hypothetical protein